MTLPSECVGVLVAPVGGSITVPSECAATVGVQGAGGTRTAAQDGCGAHMGLQGPMSGAGGCVTTLQGLHGLNGWGTLGPKGLQAGWGTGAKHGEEASEGSAEQPHDVTYNTRASYGIPVQSPEITRH